MAIFVILGEVKREVWQVGQLVVSLEALGKKRCDRALYGGDELYIRPLWEETLWWVCV